MKSPRKIVLAAYLLGLVLFGVLFVPWNEVTDTSVVTRVEPLGFAPLFDPPRAADARSAWEAPAWNTASIELDVTRLAVHLVVLTAVFGVLYLIVPTKEEPEP